MAVDALTLDGSQLSISWDSQCAPVSTNLLYGFLDQIAVYAVAGSVCGIANPGVWSTVPAGDLWFLLVSTDGIGVESSWGHGTAGERNGLVSSDQCGSFIKDVAGSCP